MAINVKYRDDGTGCRRCGEFHPDCSPCHQSPEDAALDRKQVLDTYAEQIRESMITCPFSEDSNGECRDPVECVHWGREGCIQGKAEHRGSRMPELLRECAADPLFADAVFHEFTPEQAEMVREKAGGRR